MPASTRATPTVAMSSLVGYTPTIIIAGTPHSADNPASRIPSLQVSTSIAKTTDLVCGMWQLLSGAFIAVPRDL